MAPEITDEEPDGYGTPADIWSLGCIIIEMATSRPPIRELAETQSAMFQVRHACSFGWFRCWTNANKKNLFLIQKIYPEVGKRESSLLHKCQTIMKMYQTIH